MKKNLVLIMILALAATVFGFSAVMAEDITPESLAGEYTLFSIELNESRMDPGTMGVSAVLRLQEDGTAVLVMNGAENPLPKWTVEGGNIMLFNDNGDPLECPFSEGVVTLEMGPGYLWYLADEASNPTAGQPVSRLNGIFDSIDPVAGAHLSYEYHSDFMDSVTVMDVHAKDYSYYSRKTVKAAGVEDTTANSYLGDKVYLLYPDKMSGKVVMTVSLNMLQNNPLLQDTLYKSIHTNRLRKDFTEEEREYDGKVYTVEVFPAAAYSQGIAYYFDADGNLVHILEDAPAAMPTLGETFYTVGSFDEAVDTSLFDISGYTIE